MDSKAHIKSKADGKEALHSESVHTSASDGVAIIKGDASICAA
jgi:hypothetical protein